LQKDATDLRYLFIVSGVEVLSAAGGNGSAALKVEISKAAGDKCERCWNYSTRVGEDPAHPTVCERCSAALQEIAAAR
jgi:isoleucyl-tRNA synthetase